MVSLNHCLASQKPGSRSLVQQLGLAQLRFYLSPVPRSGVRLRAKGTLDNAKGLAAGLPQSKDGSAVG